MPSLKELDFSKSVAEKPSIGDLNFSAIETTRQLPETPLDWKTEEKQVREVLEIADELELPISDIQQQFDSFNPLLFSPGGAGFGVPVGGAVGLPTREIGVWESIERADIVDFLAKFPYSPYRGAKDSSAVEAIKRLEEDDYEKYKEPAYEMTPMGGYTMFRPALTKEDDIAFLTEYSERIKEETDRGFTWPALVGKGIADLPAWMAEIYLAGGVSKGHNILSRALIHSALQPHRIRETLARVQLEDPEQSKAMTFAKSWGRIYFENMSELTGEYMVKGAKTVWAKLPFGSKYMKKLSEAWLRAKPTRSTVQFLEQISTQAGYNGILAEFGEERINTLLQSVTGVDDFGAGKDAGMLKRLEAGLKQDAKNLPVEIPVLLVPGATRYAIGKTIDQLQQDIKPPTEAPLEAPAAPPVAKVPAEGVEVAETKGSLPKAGDIQVAHFDKDTGIIYTYKGAHADVPTLEKMGLPEQEFLDKAGKGTIEGGWVDSTGEFFTDAKKALEKKPEVKEQPSTWWGFANIVSDTFYKTKISERGTILKPSAQAIKEISEMLGISQADVKRGLAIYNALKPQEEIEAIAKGKPVPIIKARPPAKPAKAEPKAKEAWEIPVSKDIVEKLKIREDLPIEPSAVRIQVYGKDLENAPSVEAVRENLKYLSEEGIIKVENNRRVLTEALKAPTPAEAAKVPAEGVKPFKATVFRGISKKTPVATGLAEGTHYTTDKKLAQSFARDYGEGELVEQEITLENPLYLTDESEFGAEANKIIAEEEAKGAVYSEAERDDKRATLMRDILEKQGYDGIVYNEGQEVIVFKAQPPAKPEAKAEPKAKEAWEMTKKQYVDKHTILEEGKIFESKVKAAKEHRMAVLQAIKDKKEIPREVLEEYKSEKWAQEALKEKPVELKPKFKTRPGFVDLTPLAEAEQQIKTTAEKAGKLTTRFGGLQPEVRKVLIEYEEQVREIPKVIAKDAIEKFGKLTVEQERAIENHRENPKKYPDLPEELKSHLKTLEEGIEEYGKRLEELGYPADWPKTYSERLEKMLQKEQAKTEPNTEKIANIKTALDEAKGLQYLHHYYQKTSVGKRIWARFRRRISKKPTGVLGRKIPTYEKAEELGLERAPLAVSYAHMAHEIARAEMANDLITAINNNPNLSLPEKQAPDDWVRLDERIFPASVQHQVWVEEGKPRHKRAYRKYPIPIAEALEEITYSRGNELIERAYDKLNFALKIIGFYNPLVMTKNDAVQIWRAAGVKGFAPLVLPKVEFQNLSIEPPRAVQIWIEKGPEYQKLRKGGLFNNIVSYTPAVTEITNQMVTHIRETSGEKAARIIKEYLNPLHLVKNMRKYNDMSTWNMDEIMRIAAYEAVKDSSLLEGMTDFEKIEWTNDALVNYGKMPKSTKRWIGKAMFVPTYRFGNFRFFKNEVSRVYQGQWRHIAPIARTVGYKMFVQWGLPAIVAAAIFYKTGKERDARTEKGYRLVIHNPETNTDTIYALSDPLLEGAKLTQRTLRHTLALNLAPIPSLVVRIATGPRFKQSDDPFGEFFKLGTPVYRDILNWKDPNKTVPQKILTQLAIAYVYTRRGREQDKEHVVKSLAKALSVWTDWKEQSADLHQMISGRSYYLGSGGKFGRLVRQFRMEQDIDEAEVDKKLDKLIAKGDYENAIKMMLETGRYQSAEGIGGRIMSWRAPALYYWQVMPSKQKGEFFNWLVENKHYNKKQTEELLQALVKSKP